MAKLFLGHQTTKGRVVYKRKRHYATVRDIIRLLFMVVNRTDAGTDPNYQNNTAPWKYISDISNQKWREFVYRYNLEHPQVNVIYERFEIGLGPAAANAEWNRLYNTLIDVLNGVSRLADWLGWIPILGQVFTYEKMLWSWIQETLHIEKKFVSVASKKEAKPKQE